MRAGAALLAAGFFFGRFASVACCTTMGTKVRGLRDGWMDGREGGRQGRVGEWMDGQRLRGSLS